MFLQPAGRKQRSEWAQTRWVAAPGWDEMDSILSVTRPALLGITIGVSPSSPLRVETQKTYVSEPWKAECRGLQGSWMDVDRRT